MTTKKSKKDVGKPAYVPRPQEVAAFKNYEERKTAETAPRVKVLNTANATLVAADHPDLVLGQALLMEAFGTASPDFLNGLIGQLAGLSFKDEQTDEGALNFLFSVVEGIKPRDQVEAMLAAQMAAIHVATFTLARRLDHVENLPQQDSAERALNKLARTFATQMEALKRYRTGGEQKVTVQHVSVSEGGQAIVGNVMHPAREAPPEGTASSPKALAPPQTAPMPIIDEGKEHAVLPARRRANKG